MIFRRLIRCHSLRLSIPPLRRLHYLGTEFFRTQLRFERGQLGFDILRSFAFADDFLAIAAQEVVDRLDANADRTEGLFSSRSLKQK